MACVPVDCRPKQRDKDTATAQPAAHARNRSKRVVRRVTAMRRGGVRSHAPNMCSVTAMPLKGSSGVPGRRPSSALNCFHQYLRVGEVRART